MELAEVRRRFLDRFGAQPRLFQAPGRVNIIGEHTDYNEGFVLPFAIDRHAVVAASRRGDRHVLVHSTNMQETFEFDLDDDAHAPRFVWSDYVEGVARTLDTGPARLAGANLLISSDVPLGAGLSSSAALEVGVASALLGMSNATLDSKCLALVAQRAEHQYVGTKSGIMDQYIAVFGRKDHCLLLDCRSLESILVPATDGDIAFVVCDTGVKHELASSEYNRRRQECYEGVRLLSAAIPDVRALRDVTPEKFRSVEQLLPEPIRRRCRHVVTENERTLRAAEALGNGHMELLGMLMSESHESLKHDYEVSCFELDVLVESARRIMGVLGARMTGGGFGGSTINLVRRSSLEDFSRQIAAAYREATDGEPVIYAVTPSGGAGELPCAA
jgi:galactokinase